MPHRWTQPASGEKQPPGQSHTGMVWLLAGGQLQAPIEQVFGKEAVPFMQQLAVVTAPPVVVQSASRGGVMVSASPASVAVSASPSIAASAGRPAAPTDVLRWQALVTRMAPSTARNRCSAFIRGSPAMGEGVARAFGETVAAAADGGEVRAPILAAARLDPQLAPDRE